MNLTLSDLGTVAVPVIILALLAWPLFGETYSLLSALGMGLAMLAVWLVTSK